MLIKRLNTFILIAIQILNVAIIMFFAMLLSELIWWVISPSNSEIYIEKMSANQFENGAKYIVNRYPFGVIVKPKIQESAPPAIIDQIKLTGVYFAGDNNSSMAFIALNGKTLVLKIGAIIMDDAIVKTINANNVIVSEGGREATVRITTSSTVANIITSGISQPNTPYVTPAMGNNPSQSMVMPTTTMYSSANDADFRERRQKMLDEISAQRYNYGSGSQPPNNIYNNGVSNNVQTDR